VPVSRGSLAAVLNLAELGLAQADQAAVPNALTAVEQVRALLARGADEPGSGSSPDDRRRRELRPYLRPRAVRRSLHGAQCQEWQPGKPAPPGPHRLHPQLQQDTRQSQAQITSGNRTATRSRLTSKSRSWPCRRRWGEWRRRTGGHDAAAHPWAIARWGPTRRRLALPGCPVKSQGVLCTGRAQEKARYRPGGQINRFVKIDGG